MTTVLSVHGAVKWFGTTHALNGAELTLQKGELLLLLGPNGAGKTTLVRAVAGRVRLDSGEIALFGVRIDGRNPMRHRLGIVPQEIALYPLLTARENLEVFGRLHGLDSAALQERVRWALTWTGLEDRANEPIKQFSGGMKRRLNIAAGVLHQPDVVLLDEPTVGVDPQSRERIWEMLDKLRAAGASLVLTTHQLDEAQTRCDRIVIIDHGRTVTAGTLGELVERSVGSGRWVTLTLDRKVSADVASVGEPISDTSVRFKVANVAAELPSLLQRVSSAGHGVEDVVVESPSLQAVFLNLTGRELRE